MLKEFRDRAHDDSFAKELAEEAEVGDGSARLRPGKKSKTESLSDVLEQLSESGLDGEARERLAVAYLLARRAPGTELDGAVALEFGRRLGMDLGDVRVHTDSATTAIARALGVTAFTFGRDIFFASGAYQPTSPRGRRVLAHEVAHVAQHGGSRPAPGSPLAVGREGDRHEREADIAASRVTRGRSARVSRAEPGVRFLRQAFGELDEPIVANGAAGLGCSAEELEHIKKLVMSATPDELARMLDGASAVQRNIIFYCIGQSDMAQEDAIKAFMRNHDNPQPETKVEVHGVNQAQRVTDQASRESRGEKKSDIEAQIDEAPRIPTVSANSANAEQGPGPEAQGGGGSLDVAGVAELSSSDQQLINEELIAHEVWLQTATSSDAAIEAFVTDPANFLDVGVAGAVELLERLGLFSSMSQKIAGARSLFALIDRDWERTWERLSAYGDGATEYARLAGNIATVIESVDLMLSIFRSIAAGLGTASGAMWLNSVMSSGDAGQVASILTAVALGVTSAAGVLGMVRSGILVPAEEAFRALDRFQRQADPSAPEQAADLLIDGAQGILALLGSMATTPDAGGPQDATGSARAGASEKADNVTNSSGDLPLQDVSIQGYESSEGEASDVADDAAGIAVRDKSRDPSSEIDGKKLSATEVADTFSGEGKPDVSKKLVDDRDDQVDDAIGGQSELAGGDNEHASDGDLGLSDDSAPLELKTGSDPSNVGSRTTDSLQRDESLELLESFTGDLESQDSDVTSSASPQTEGRANPPTTLRFLHQVYRTLAFLTQMRRQAEAGNQSSDASQSSQTLMQRVTELRSEVAKREDAHRTQKQRLERATAVVSQFAAERSRVSSSIDQMMTISEVMPSVGTLPGRLGRAIAARYAEIMRVDRTWKFVSSQMAGQEQEMHAMRARQVTEARRLEATADRANRARALLGQADSALQAAAGSESDSVGSAELGAIDSEIDRYKSIYGQLSGQLVAWSQRNRAIRTEQS